MPISTDLKNLCGKKGLVITFTRYNIISDHDGQENFHVEAGLPCPSIRVKTFLTERGFSQSKLGEKYWDGKNCRAEVSAMA